MATATATATPKKKTTAPAGPTVADLLAAESWVADAEAELAEAEKPRLQRIAEQERETAAKKELARRKEVYGVMLTERERSIRAMPAVARADTGIRRFLEMLDSQNVSLSHSKAMDRSEKQVRLDEQKRIVHEALRELKAAVHRRIREDDFDVESEAEKIFDGINSVDQLLGVA